MTMVIARRTLFLATNNDGVHGGEAGDNRQEECGECDEWNETRKTAKCWIAVTSKDRRHFNFLHQTGTNPVQASPTMLRLAYYLDISHPV